MQHEGPAAARPHVAQSAGAPVPRVSRAISASRDSGGAIKARETVARRVGSVTGSNRAAGGICAPGIHERRLQERDGTDAGAVSGIGGSDVVWGIEN